MISSPVGTWLKNDQYILDNTDNFVDYPNNKIGLDVFTFNTSVITALLPMLTSRHCSYLEFGLNIPRQLNPPGALTLYMILWKP